jgi:hypothetical protein
LAMPICFASPGTAATTGNRRQAMPRKRFS